MNNNIDKLQAWILFGFTCFVAISLAVNAIGALLGRANLAWWHYFTLAASSSLTEASLQRDQRIMLKRLFRNARKKADGWFYRSYLRILRAVRGLSALFTGNDPEMQTEP